MSILKLYMMIVKAGKNNFVYLHLLYTQWLEKTHTHKHNPARLLVHATHTHILAIELKLCWRHRCLKLCHVGENGFCKMFAFKTDVNQKPQLGKRKGNSGRCDTAGWYWFRGEVWLLLEVKQGIVHCQLWAILCWRLSIFKVNLEYNAKLIFTGYFQHVRRWFTVFSGPACCVGTGRIRDITRLWCKWNQNIPSSRTVCSSLPLGILYLLACGMFAAAALTSWWPWLCWCPCRCVTVLFRTAEQSEGVQKTLTVAAICFVRLSACSCWASVNVLRLCMM